MRIVCPNNRFRLPAAIEVCDQCLDRFHHVPVAQIPGRGATAKHGAVILLRVFHQPRILLCEEKFLRGHFAVAAEEFSRSALQLGELLDELQRRAGEFLSRDGEMAAEELFFAEQNARLVKNAEQYYRSMFRGRASSWNLRDRHMVETIENLVAHLDGSRQPKAIVWAHNSHLGDARATEMSHYGEVNVGQLMRERFGDEAVLIGFSTHHGTVTAASDWGAPTERKNVRPALRGGYEELFHETGLPRFWIDLQGAGQIGVLQQRRIERAIGVIYRPDTERLSHYFHARLP